MTEHPLTIDCISTPEGGTIGMCACPGRNHVERCGEIRVRNFSQDIDEIRKWGADVVVTLIEAAEFEQLGIPDLPDRMAREDFRWLHFPIPDLRAPDYRSGSDWSRFHAELLGRLKKGSRILIHCAAGKGRTGTVAAGLLIKLGAAPEAAIDQVRRARRGAIESDEQLHFLTERVLG